MKIERDSLTVIDFDGIGIRDYTAGQDTSSSLAEITVPPGGRHQLAWSRRSDKYYYSLEGRLNFTVGDQALELRPGDVCLITKGTRFSYENTSPSVARVLLMHTPSFVLEEEVFEE